MGGPSSSGNQRRSRFYNRFHVLGAFLLGCCFATAAITFFHFSTLDSLHDVSVAMSSSVVVHHPMKVAREHRAKTEEHHLQKADAKADAEVDAKISGSQKLAANHDNLVHPVAGLDCSDHDGPMSIDDSKEIVYWRDIPSDNSWVSPFKKTDTRQYLTFEPDGGGWNNIRMSMETVLTMALAMGRVLVLPPSQTMYLLGKGNSKFNFADFFPLQELAAEHPGLEIISMEQFLKETMGKTIDSETHEVSYPPENKRTAWDGDTKAIKNVLSPWIRKVSLMPDWNPDKCVAAFPKSTDPQDEKLLQQAFDEIAAEEGGKYLKPNAWDAFINKPTPVDAPMKDRLREFISQQTKICIYDSVHQQAPIIHFHGKHKSEHAGGRLLVHFYAFLFFQDWETDLWMKRFVRDHVRYIDNIQCAAARIVHQLRTTHGGHYDSFHIRRGDFQYKNTRLDAKDIVANSRDVIEEGRVVYVGTDERDKNFFKPLVEDAGWNIFFLDDFMDIVGKNINPNYYGMIDQLVVSRGDRFFGCWFSTFTGYIMRLRGYHSQAEIADGGPNAEAFAQGKLPNSYYYALKEHKTKMHDYWPTKQSFYAREFPTSWWQLDVSAKNARVGSKRILTTSTAESPSMKKALECLRHTKPELPDLSYPRDAYEHFQEIHHRLDRFLQRAGHKPHRAAGYQGPWIENRWISHFQHELESKHNSLPDVFGPYIPLLIPWTDIWLENKHKYPRDLVSSMLDLLREDVLYITVNQNDDGFVGRCTEFRELQERFHIIVLSAGGYGHVPIPLLKQPETPRQKIPPGDRTHLISYVGSQGHAPASMRQNMIAQKNHFYYRGKDWRNVMAQSKFSLCPRGFGRTSYHLMETLQMGLIPIQVYLDQPWMPYENLMKNISFSVTVEELPDLITQLSKMSDREIVDTEERIKTLRKEYFSFDGLLKQISYFMLNPASSELVCQELPSDSGSPKKGTAACG